MIGYDIMSRLRPTLSISRVMMPVTDGDEWLVFLRQKFVSGCVSHILACKDFASIPGYTYQPVEIAVACAWQVRYTGTWELKLQWAVCSRMYVLSFSISGLCSVVVPQGVAITLYPG